MTAITMYGTATCSDCVRSKRQLDGLGVPYEYVDLASPDAGPLVQKVIDLNGGKRTVPTIVFQDGTHLAEPTNDELAAKLEALGIL